ncbi:MAG: type II toxin-antitoxin system HicB family antitoxin [Desulfovibrio sp.]|jgi:predicted RNase H-like HicB family nuclease|nr:type II toxin-antitoxin system HicB family antitoxin [Desulfovibrio sp.]
MEQLSMMPLEVHFKPSDNKKYWIASCPDLDLATQGETFERAEQNLREAIMLFIESCLQRGTLDEILRQAGYTEARINTVAEAAAAYLPRCGKSSAPRKRCRA